MADFRADTQAGTGADTYAKVRVLIVDDMAQVRHDLKTVLRLAGESANVEVIVVGEAENGREAVEKVLALKPDAVLMDLEMPVMDGYTATREIKASCPAIRVIALTAHGYPAAREKARQAGVDDLIVKGTSVTEIIQSILSTQAKDTQS